MKIKFIIFLIMVATIIFIFTINSCTLLTPAEITSKDTSVNETESKETEVTTAKETETTSKDTTLDQIRVIKPLPNQVIQSPLIIEGEARGTWFFEATFPVKLMDANGNVVATYFAMTEDDWMTEDFVPFKVQLIFEKPATATGILILEKDNPSGLPENDASIEIPVRFDN